MHPVTFFASLLVLAAACYFGVRAYRLDRQLRRLLPSRIVQQWNAKESPRSHDLADQIPFYFLRVFPAHWQPRLHADRGAALVGQLYLVLGLTWCLAMLGFALLSRVIAPAG